MLLFERFGEFDSVEELNMTAEGLKEEGDLESLKVLAVENGLDAADAEDYANGIVTELSSDLMAAAGKIAVESKALGIDGIMSDWKDTVIEECAEDKAFCAAVRKKGKYLKEYMAKLIQYSFENKVPVSAEILEITKVKHNGKLENFNGPLYLGIPNRMEVRKIARKYYLGE